MPATFDSSDSPVTTDCHDVSSPGPTVGIPVSETFSSRQGEGKLTGTPSFFIRTSGCNLRCWFCDTPYASWNPSGEKRSLCSLVEDAVASGNKHVVLTGGEPLLPAAAESIAHQLMDAGMHLTIETAGTLDKPIACDLLSISPKLTDSAPNKRKHPGWHQRHQERRLPLAVMRRLIDAAKDFQIKFVVADSTQFGEVNSIAQSLDVAANNVYIMPQGTTVAEMDAAIGLLKPWCDDRGYQYCDRMQIRWYGNRRGT